MSVERIEEFLKERRERGLLRELLPSEARGGGLIRLGGEELVDLSSNDYLDLSHHPELKRASIEAAEEFGAGSGASRLLSGDLQIHHELEEECARFKKKEAALVFNSGYQANLGIISALSGKGDAVFFDRLSHASIVDGILLSGARFFRFGHNDAGHLESLLKKERGRFKEALVVTETVFSMDGDIPPLKELVRLKEEYGCRLLVDEAHATGVFGPDGGGVVSREGLCDEVDLIMGTFSKALGSFGAYVASSKSIKEYLINSSRPFIYSTALPPPCIAASMAAIDIIKREPGRRETLLGNAEYLRNGLKERGVRAMGSSQIVPFVVGESPEAVRLSEGLKKRGYRALPIRPPTVPQGEARLRFSLSSAHTKDMLERLLDGIAEIHKI